MKTVSVARKILKHVPHKAMVTKRQQLERDLAHVNQEMYQRNLELADTNRTLSLLTRIDELALHIGESLDTLSDRICSMVGESENCPLVCIYLNSLQSSETKKMKMAGLSIAAGERSQHAAALRSSTLSVSGDWFLDENKVSLVRLELLKDAELAALLGVESSTVGHIRATHKLSTLYIVKISARQKLIGVMLVGFTRDSRAIRSGELMLLDRLSEAIGVAIDNKMLTLENEKVVRQLQRTNEKLQALDAAKDEFVSMASHQLRTPLTSVKGYISMVLEGDAGELAPMQQDLLRQAFVSSQRMVYLIADLLNVSRLKTGKFVIENKPTSLAEVVQGEVEQLRETAKVHNIELIYKKPADFPLLQLDETKIRQVAMNFIDNAIYYTPAGGKITVELKASPKSVEYTVTDTGIGVPKAERHRLFTKFYRANNARKARPDGTGLGLFMAKKVIIAQGGSIIFKTQEGKGSTFGFSFPLDVVVNDSAKTGSIVVDMDSDDDTSVESADELPAENTQTDEKA